MSPYINSRVSSSVVVLESVKDAIQVLENCDIGLIQIPELVQPYVIVCINQNVHLFNNA